ncbi:uncharacterized protein LOC122572761 [Bombus pyrosoma]|uniref:uncharacterized protein LOC122572761 n=1 Tax=Bombus pyrosoma TaxID=396416 RepID=UPI001CB8B120|nr:uncharacterized protein LOC122572761 [Bombus pyrosoma]
MKNGSKNSNDDNAFQETQILANTTGVNINLPQNLRTIIITIFCQFSIDLKKFKLHYFHNAKLFKKTSSWYPMPQTIYKILIHSRQIFNNAFYSQGYLAENAAESKNKFYKYDRQFHACKNSCKNNLRHTYI